MNEYTTKANLLKLAVLSYILTCVTGIAVILPFVLKQPAAGYFNSNLGYMGFVFSFFMFGMLIGELLNGFIVKFLRVKAILYITAMVYLLCVLLMFLIHNPVELIPLLLIIGFCAGITTTIPNFIIVHAFDGSARSSKLNRIDFFFSVGSLAYPLVAGWMILYNCLWQAVYLSVVIFFVLIVIMCLTTVIPDMNSTESVKDVKFSKWNLNVYLVAFAIFFYFLSYIGFTYWVTAYLEKYLHISEYYANFGVTLFWLFYAIGCFISSFAVKVMPVNKYIILSAIVSFISYILIAISANTIMMLVCISILGLGCATVYSSSISYGSLLVEHPSPRIVSFFITTSGIGTWLAEVYSSYVKVRLGVPAIIVLSAVFMLLVIVIMYVVSKRNQREINLI